MTEQKSALRKFSPPKPPAPFESWSEYRSFGKAELELHSEACRVGGCRSYCACWCHYPPEDR